MKNYLKATKTALSNLMTKPNTVIFPLESVETPSGFRGTPVLTVENCTLCKVCRLICPTHAIEISLIEGDTYEFSIDIGRCCYCAECEAICKFDAIHLEETWMTSELEREKLRKKETVIRKRKG